MNNIEDLKTLEKYDSELADVISRFKHTHEGVWIGDGDQPNFDQLVIELRDLYSDIFGDDDYGNMTVQTYNKGQDNFYESSSLNSVERVKSILLSAKTRLERTPNPKNKEQRKNKTDIPTDKITLAWLFNHVPLHIWGVLLGLLIATFSLGITATIKLSFIQEWFGVTIN